MLDDDAKIASWCSVREGLLTEELDRVEQFIRLIIETTPYSEKSVAYKPRIAGIRTHGLLGDFVNRCKERNIDIALTRTNDCVIRIHAPCPRRRDKESAPSPQRPERKRA